ncbi:hypothetical protein [Hymenobacter metallicola]|uniref:Uncharacterized protein n=1 Tax=Hymenobacter metallicola TaxID=2563114 RepID=A0A4Z0PT03_9BACT|nr:hypothetical protein [Hymenobacter metallicola]TGE20857.1 hypothetical protein E5K02_25395 [Hymenobacter metallicola]
MSRPYHLGLFILGTITLGSCRKQLEEAEYRAYLQDAAHGLTQTRAVGSATVMCSYRPTDLLVAQELAGAPRTSPAMLDSLRHHFAGKTYFSLSLAQNGTEIENQYIRDATAFTQAVVYLGSGIAHDVYLVNATDSVVALTALYPRQYGSTGRSTVLLLFDTTRLDLRQGFTLSYHDTRFQLGTVRFAFEGEDIDRLPTLKF